MRKQTLGVLLSVSLMMATGCGGPPRTEDLSPIDSQLFLGEWFDYYNRALRRIRDGEYAKAESDLRAALRLQPEDSHRKRVYGVRFQTYYPHRELGIVRLEQGDYREALEHLQIARHQAETAKGNYFLNESRRIMIAREGLDVGKPDILLAAGDGPILTNDSAFVLEGRVIDSAYVGSIVVGDTPEYFEVAEKEKSFETGLHLREGINRITVSAENLAGRWAEKVVEIELDRQGPSLSLVEAREDPNAVGRRVFLKGSVFDAQGLKTVRIGEKTLRASGQRQEFGDWFDLEEERPWLAYEFQDGTGNVSRGRIDVFDEEGNILIGQVWKEGERVWIASTVDLPQAIAAGTSLGKVGFDFRELDRIKTVYQDQVSLSCRIRHHEGKAIRKIVCGDLEISGDPASERYFHQIISLATGENTIVITVEDEEGTEFSSSKTIVYEEPARRSNENNLRVALSGFRSEQDISPILQDTSYHEFYTELTRGDRFNLDLVEREIMEKIDYERQIAYLLGEMNLEKMERADLIVQGTIVEDPPRGYTFYLDIIDVKTAEQIRPRLDVYHPGMDSAGISDLMRGLYLKLVYLFPKVEGNVIAQRGSDVFTTLKQEHRIRRGMELVVFREGEPMLVDGISYGAPEEVIGNLEVKRVQADLSNALVLEIVAEGQDVQPGDIVVTK